MSHAHTHRHQTAANDECSPLAEPQILSPFGIVSVMLAAAFALKEANKLGEDLRALAERCYR
jgi:hypothetical protein